MMQYFGQLLASEGVKQWFNDLFCHRWTKLNLQILEQRQQEAQELISCICDMSKYICVDGRFISTSKVSFAWLC